MSRPKKRMENGRLTAEAAGIVVEMLREGVVKGELKWMSGRITSHTFEEELDADGDMPYLIGDYWVCHNLSWSGDTLVGFVSKTDRKEFKRRWRERYPKEVKPETQVETKSESETELTYPLFAKSRGNGAIILFTSVETGVCVKAKGSTSYERWADAWVDATDTNHWQHLTFAEAEAEIFGRLRRELEPKAETV